MPIYEYMCRECGHRFEKLQSISEEPVRTCPQCGGPVKKLISRTSFILKGTGWYATDYARKDSGKDSSSKSSGSCSSCTSKNCASCK